MCDVEPQVPTLETALVVPTLVYASASVQRDGKRTPDDAMEAALALLLEKAKRLPARQKHFSNKLVNIQRNDMHDPKYDGWTVTLTAEVVAHP